MIILHFHLQPQFNELFHIYTSLNQITVRNFHLTIEWKNIYIITQVFPHFDWFSPMISVLEDRCTIDVIITKFFPLSFKMAESFENLDNILHG